jgi:hypothetical protein
LRRIILEFMSCPSCGHRKGRRQCPALRQTICAQCCGTKRLVEIRCPSDCGYLSSAREHPAAVVRRQQERAVATLGPTIRHLTERQQQLYFLFQSVIARHTPQGFGRLVDDDVAEAAGTLAKTLETASRGVIYDHTAQSPIAQGLIADLKTLLDQIREQGGRVFDGETAITLRAIEQGARTVRTSPDERTAYLDLMATLLNIAPGQEQAPAGAAPSSLILP